MHCAFLGTEVVWPDKGQGKKKAYTSKPPPLHLWARKIKQTRHDIFGYPACPGYNIAVSLQGTDARWFLKSRWSRFERLQKAVRQELAGQEADLPLLSSKTGEDAVGASILNARGWLNPLDPELVELRRVAVQSFINALIERPAVLRSAAFMDFLLPGEAVVAAEAAVAGAGLSEGGDAHSVQKKKLDVVLPDPIPWSDGWLSPAEGVADIWADEGVLAEDLAKPLAPSAEHWQDRPRQRCTLNQLVARLTSAGVLDAEFERTYSAQFLCQLPRSFEAISRPFLTVFSIFSPFSPPWPQDSGNRHQDLEKRFEPVEKWRGKRSRSRDLLRGVGIFLATFRSVATPHELLARLWQRFALPVEDVVLKSRALDYPGGLDALALAVG